MSAPDAPVLDIPVFNPRQVEEAQHPRPRSLQDLPSGEFLPQHTGLIGRLATRQLVEATLQDRSRGAKNWWLEYFWREASPFPTQIAGYAGLVEFFNHTFELPPAWNPGSHRCELELRGTQLYYSARAPKTALKTIKLAPKRTGWADDDESQPSSGIWRGMLDHLLSVGFEGEQPVGPAPPNTPATSAFHPDIDVRRAGLVCELNGRAYMLGWRGDSRSRQEIQDAHGLRNAVESEDYATARNMRRIWHPFSDPQRRSTWLYRNAQQDNCLYTLVSVAIDFKSATTFPKLDDCAGPLRNRPTSLGSWWSCPSRNAWFQVKGRRLGRQGQGQVFCHVDRQQLYLVMVTTQYFDTQQKQQTRNAGKFPEIAVKEIPDNSIFACVPYIRVFHGTTDAEGITMLRDNTRVAAQPIQAQCRQYTGEDASGDTLFAKVNGVYTDAVTAVGAGYSVCWQSTGAIQGPALKDDSGADMIIESITDPSGKLFWP